jgi:hypothetical protein
MCIGVDKQWTHGVVIASLRSSVQSLLHQRRDLLQSTYPYLAEDREPTSHHEVPKTPWVGCCNRAWGTTGAGVAAILISPSGIKLCYAARMQFNNKADKCNNKIAEYVAILMGLRKLRAIRVQRCILRTDSKVVAGQIEKECIAREPTLERCLGLVRRMVNYFKGFTVGYIE